MAESMSGLRRTCRCAEVTEEMIGQKVTLMGWVAKCRNKGGIVFVDMRDRSGIMQVIYEGVENAGSLRSEFCIAATGIVRRREGAVNPNLKTGSLEIEGQDLRILSSSETPPFHVLDGIDTREDLRLRYRYLDLRRPELQKKIMFRSRLVSLVREFMDREGFLDIETPDLIGSTPEGARDYLVPSRVHPGCFYALPQSPQLFKQLLMCSGFDRYYQIARCFRDEDLRADRQPEFTQIDMELSFVDQDDVMDVNTRLLGFVLSRLPEVYEQLGFDTELAKAAKNAAEKINAEGIAKMPWQQAMDLYGSDKPDLRFGMPIVDVTDSVRDCGFGARFLNVYLAESHRGGGQLFVDLADLVAVFAVFLEQRIELFELARERLLLALNLLLLFVDFRPGGINLLLRFGNGLRSVAHIGADSLDCAQIMLNRILLDRDFAVDGGRLLLRIGD